MATIRLYEEDDADGVLKLAKLCYEDATGLLECWKWRYFGLNTRPSQIYLATYEGGIIGTQPMALFNYALGGKTLVGAALTDVMVHPAHRRKGIFSILVDACVESAWKQGADFVTTMPNDLSYPGFMKLGWVDPGDRTLLIRPVDLITLARRKVWPSWLGRTVAALPQMMVRVTGPRRLRSALSVEEVCRFGADADDLNHRTAAAYGGIVLQRDSGWLNWRYVNNPLIRYELFEARSSDGDLKGISATTMETRKGMRVGYIVELIGETAEARRVLISAAVRKLEQEGAEIVAAVMSAPAYLGDLRNQGFYAVPGYLSPKKFHTVYMPNPEKLSFLEPLRRIQNWHQTLGDWDTI